MKCHGEISFFWDEDLLTVYLKGPFNKEGFEQAFSQLKDSVLSQKHIRWRRLQILDEQTISSPEAIAYAKSTWDWFLQHGCDRFAIVVANGIQSHFLRGESSNQIRVFSAMSDAQKWLGQ